MNRVSIFLAGIFLAAIPHAVGCAQVEKGTGKALGNANGVVNTYAPKVWGPGETPPQTETAIDPVTGEKKPVSGERKALEKRGS